MNHRKVLGLVGILAVSFPAGTNIGSCVASTYTILKYGNSGDGVIAAKEIHAQGPKPDY
ncbi:TPA: hypothetical protein HA242_06690 [Candidatus Woesearchaeota archaeon]|nr:hypothetical protein [Candidatus Woesearchaeota archaeon]HIH13381.1 hypothetical protein [Candidatus Woesearchaeota archaeon]